MISKSEAKLIANGGVVSIQDLVDLKAKNVSLDKI